MDSIYLVYYVFISNLFVFVSVCEVIKNYICFINSVIDYDF